MKNMKLGTKLILGFSCIAVMLIVGGIIGSYGIYQTETALKDANKVRLPGVKALAAMKEAQASARVSERSLLVPEFFNDDELKNRQLAGFDAVVKKMKEASKIFESLPKSDAQSTLWKNVKTSWDTWKKDSGQYLEIIKSGNREEALALSNGRLRESSSAVARNIDDLMALNLKEAQESEAKNEKAAAFFKILASVGTIAGVILAVSFGYFFSLMITRPIMHVIQGIKGGTDQISAAASQISSASQSLAEGASEQASAIEETSSSLEEMSSMSKSTMENSNLMAATGDKSYQAMRNSHKSLRETNECMKRIGASGAQAAKIIKASDDIAFQINLLALNAAVEAARAGEAGAGFAVVADEVRNLAMRSAEAARNTEQIIGEMSQEIENGNALVAKTLEAFYLMGDEGKKTNELIKEIDSATREQTQGIEQINKAVSEMDKVTQQTAASAEESASAAEELNAQALQIKSYVGELLAVIEGKGGGDVDAGGDRKQGALPGPKARKNGCQKKKPDPREVIPLDGDDFRDF